MVSSRTPAIQPKVAWDNVGEGMTHVPPHRDLKDMASRGCPGGAAGVGPAAPCDRRTGMTDRRGC